MIRSGCAVVLLLLGPSLVLGQESHSPQNTEGVRPCTLHPVNGRICISEGVLHGLLMRYVPPKLPRGADENGEVLLHVIVPRTGGKPARISAISGDPALMRLAVRAVREWVFLSYRYEGKEVEMEGDLHIRFKTAQ
jgi:Gram-negative bacterial TonB protein C-terminal